MKTLSTILLMSMTIMSFGQSAWNKSKNEGFFKLSQTTIVSDQFYNNDKEIVGITTTGVYITSIYGEYGITDRFTGFIYFPFFVRNTLNEMAFANAGTTAPGDELNSLGDTNIGIAYGLMQNSTLVINTSLTLGVPLGNNGGGDTGLLQTGDGEFNQLIKVNLGYSFYPLPLYATASVGFNNRTKDFSDEFHLSAEVGVTIIERFNLALKVYNLASFENGDAASSQNGIFANNTEYLAYGPELSYTHEKKFGASISYQGAANGRNILASPSYSFGVHYQF